MRAYPREPGSLHPQERLVWQHLTANRGRLVTTDELIGVLYPDPDREPECPERIVYQAIHTLRAVHGKDFDTMRGWRLPPLHSAPDAHPAGEAA